VGSSGDGMNFPTPIPLTQFAYAAAAAGALTVIAYLLKIRRRRFEVPFSTLWARVLEQRDANVLWRQLKRILSLLLMLAILFVVFFAALNPTVGGLPPSAKSVVILIDTSASMKTSDAKSQRQRDVDLMSDDEVEALIAEAQRRKKTPLRVPSEQAREFARAILRDETSTEGTRIAAAKDAAKGVIDSMGGADVAMIMRVDSQATPLSRFDSDGPMLRRVVDGLKASDTPADLHRALAAAADALHDRQNPMIILISDGAYTDQQLASVSWDDPATAGKPAEASAGSGSAAPVIRDEIAARRKSYEQRSLATVNLHGIDVRYVPVGTRADNVGIVAFNVRRYVSNKAAYEVFIEVENFGPNVAHRQLTLYNGDSAIDVQPITLEGWKEDADGNRTPGQKIRRIYPGLSGGTDHRLRASLRPVDGEGGSDPFPLDDEAFALLPDRKKQKVLLVTADNLYLEGAMLVYDNIEVFKITPEEYAAKPDEMLAEVHVVVFDDYTPPEIPPAPVHAIYFHPTGPSSPIKIAKEIAHPPRIDAIAEEHPVMRWVQLSDVNFDRSQVFALDKDRGEASLASTVRNVVIAAKREGGRKLLCFGFPLSGTDLTLRVAFPLLLVNSLDWFASDDADLVTTYATGARLRVPLDGVTGVTEAVVIGPDGRKVWAAVSESSASFVAAEIGFHEIKAYTPPAEGQIEVRVFPDADEEPLAMREIAANLSSPEESDIQPASELRLGGAAEALKAPEKFEVATKRQFWTLLLAGLLILLGIEWITYHRRITV